MAELKSLKAFSLLIAYPPPVRLTCLVAGRCGTNPSILSMKNKIIAMKKDIAKGRSKDEKYKNTFKHIVCIQYVIYDNELFK